MGRSAKRVRWEEKRARKIKRALRRKLEHRREKYEVPMAAERSKRAAVLSPHVAPPLDREARRERERLSVEAARRRWYAPLRMRRRSQG